MIPVNMDELKPAGISSPNYKLLEGNLLDMAEDGDFDVIVHGCNCQNVMGAGIADQIRRRWPGVYREDTRFGKLGKARLGKYSASFIRTKNKKSCLVVNAYTQLAPAMPNEDAFNYEAFNKVLLRLAWELPPQTRVGMPLIGMGLAGGDKDKILSAIHYYAQGRDVTIVVYKGG